VHGKNENAGTSRASPGGHKYLLALGRRQSLVLLGVDEVQPVRP
jgi:hypothetical protein